MTIKAVIFDYGGVLMRTVDPRPRRELEQDLGLEVFGSDRLVFGHPMWDQAQLGQITSEQFWAVIADQLGVDSDGLEGFRRRFWSGDRLDGEMVSFMQDLRAHGYLLGLLSNNPSGLRQRVDELMPGLFHSYVISGEDGVMKPDAAIYRLAIERLAVRAGDAVFVDDYERNVVGARAAGLEAVHFRGLAPLREELRRLGMTVPETRTEAAEGIRAIIVDWGGVLEPLPGATRLAGWARELGVTDSELRDALWGQDHRLLELGLIDGDKYARRLASRLNLPDARAADRFLRQYYSDSRVDSGVAAAMLSLRSRYMIGLVTNADRGHAARAREGSGIDVRQAFDVYINSSEVGLRKPDPAIYELAVERLGCEPHQVVVVDDALRNVDSARALGMQAVQFVDLASSLRELEGLLGHSIAYSGEGAPRGGADGGR